MNDPFNSPAFGLVEMTNSMNVLPNSYGRIGELGLFVPKGVSQRTVIIEEKNGTLGLIQSAAPGSQGQVNRSGSRKVRSLAVPHFPLDDMILPEDVAGVRAFGSQSEAETVASRINDKLTDMKAKHDITHEWLKVGAMKGLILDADGSTLYDLYSEFGITAKSIDFVLGTAGTNVANKVRDVLRHTEDNLMGEVSTGVKVLASPEFFDRFISHPKVEAAYAGYAAAAERIGGDMRKGFAFGGLVIEEYRGKATNGAGVTTRFIAAGEAHAFPLGTRSTFQLIAAPADFNETVNTIGKPYYAKAEPRKFGRGMDVHTQSNVLPICYRPATLVRLFSSN